MCIQEVNYGSGYGLRKRIEFGSGTSNTQQDLDPGYGEAAKLENFSDLDLGT